MKKPTISVRRPPPPSAAVERFVTSEQVPRPAAPLLNEPPRGRGIVTRKEGPARRRMTVYLPPELAQRLSVFCAARGLEMSAIIADAVLAHLDREQG